MIRVDLENAGVVFTTRAGGFSPPPYDSLNLGAFTEDDPGCIARNLETVRSTLGLERVHLLHQVHGSEIVDVHDRPTDTTTQGDGMITSAVREGLLVTGADCPPVVLAGADRIAIVHCGWKPLAAGIVESAAERINGQTFEAVIGPGICGDHYEVGEEVVEAIGEDAEAEFAGGRLSLSGVIRRKLERLGAERVKTVDRCTYGEPAEFFSYRRDGMRTGRQAGIAWRH
ncbi:MAG TPA: polyphenol oxidase family protein [Solirubrobacterales bacterium]|jgi:YfiH family protein|nr:polyphenol oxidase family protein [Solirubrobacterales bacterium]